MKGRPGGPGTPFPPHFKDKYNAKICELFTALTQPIPDIDGIISIFLEETKSIDVEVFFSELIEAMSDDAITNEHRFLISVAFARFISHKCDMVQLISCIMKEFESTNDGETLEHKCNEFAEKIRYFSMEDINNTSLDVFKDALSLQKIEKQHFSLVKFTIYSFSMRATLSSGHPEDDTHYRASYAEAIKFINLERNRICTADPQDELMD